MKPKLLFTTPILAYPASGGPMLRIQNSIKALTRIGELHLISQVPKAELGERAEQYYRKLVHSFSYAEVPHSGDQQVRAQNALSIVQYCRTHQIDTVWCGYGNISYPLIAAIKQRAPDLKLICDTDSVWSRFVMRELPFCSDPVRQREIELEGRQKMAEEREGSRIADITTAVSDVDAAYYRGIASDPSRIHIFSNVIDLDEYRAIPSPALPNIGPYLYLAGSFYSATAPMTEAARWLLSEVWPAVKSRVPNASCVILGRGADRELATLSGTPGVFIKGYVDSVLPYLCHSAAAVVPLHFESGTRFKILEAAACRIPVVSTTLGAEGIPVQHGHDILLADSPKDFADACVELLLNHERGVQLAGRCYSLVAEQNSLATLERQALAILAAPRGRVANLDSLRSEVEVSRWDAIGRQCGVQHAVYSAVLRVAHGPFDPQALVFIASHTNELYQVLPNLPTWIPDHIADCMERLSAQYKAGA